ncbi:23S rRNA (pseudouridine(1915)-N(3))-methyltransferase RlmH [Candidatus Saccharibacteria bacterium]|nr:23S rRNA (pseudouridine(1915)-N(3))-methyltransferase RlmH [Candidatus Saccharibacteria bacterium]
MITIIAGGKKHSGEYGWLIRDYSKRVRKPYDFEFKFFEGEKLDRYLEDWPFTGRDFVIVTDERGKVLTSPEFSETLEKAFSSSRDVKIIIGGAYGVSEEVREKADLVWSFSRLVFPHMIARLIVAEQIYRAQEIAKGSGYHHE